MDASSAKSRVFDLAQRVSMLQSDVVESRTRRLAELDSGLSNLEERLEESQTTTIQQLEEMKNKIIDFQSKIEEEVIRRHRLDEAQSKALNRLSEDVTSTLQQGTAARAALDQRLRGTFGQFLSGFRAEIDDECRKLEAIRLRNQQVLDERLPALSKAIDAATHERVKSEYAVQNALNNALTELQGGLDSLTSEREDAVTKIRSQAQSGLQDLVEQLKTEKETRDNSEQAIITLCEEITRSYLAAHSIQ